MHLSSLIRLTSHSSLSVASGGPELPFVDCATLAAHQTITLHCPRVTGARSGGGGGRGTGQSAPVTRMEGHGAKAG